LSRLHESNAGFDFHDSVLPLYHEPIITKQVNSAFIGTNLKEQLELLHINTLVIVGMTTNHCISTTTRMAGNYGFETYLISDATATFDRVGIFGEKYDAETIHMTALANLKDEFATIWTSQVLLQKI
jgi:nicotinamidase-related amidase